MFTFEKVTFIDITFTFGRTALLFSIGIERVFMYCGVFMCYQELYSDKVFDVINHAQKRVAEIHTCRSFFPLPKRDVECRRLGLADNTLTR